MWKRSTDLFISSNNSINYIKKTNSINLEVEKVLYSLIEDSKSLFLANKGCTQYLISRYTINLSYMLNLWNSIELRGKHMEDIVLVYKWGKHTHLPCCLFCGNATISSGPWANQWRPVPGPPPTSTLHTTLTLSLSPIWWFIFKISFVYFQ